MANLNVIKDCCSATSIRILARLAYNYSEAFKKLGQRVALRCFSRSSGAARQSLAKLASACGGKFCAFDFMGMTIDFSIKSKAKFSDAYGIRKFEKAWWLRPQAPVESLIPV